jgi:oligoendopeptidase F
MGQEMSTKHDYPAVDPLNWDTVKPAFDALLAAQVDAQTAEAWLQQWSDLEAVLEEAGAQIYREVTENTADEAAEKRFTHFVEQILPAARVAIQALKQKLLALPGYQPSPDTTVLLRRFSTEAEIFRNENVALESKLTVLGNQYNKIVGGMEIEWQGQKETLPMARSHLEEPDRATRQAVWQRMMDCFLAQRQTLNGLYLEMVPLRRQVARNAGFATYRDYRWLQLARFDYSPQDCFTYHDAIEREVVPLATEIYRDRTRKLGIDRMRPWDTDADPAGAPLRPFRDVEELEEGCSRVFEQVDPVLAGQFTMLRDGYLDLASRPNKAPGGYCNGFPVSGKPYIFMNAVGTHDNVTTLLHEGGHAFHFVESLRQPLVWNQNGPMEFCEVASMSMELLAAPYLGRKNGGFYEEVDVRRAFAQELEKIVLFLPYMAVVDAFQHWVHADAPDEVSASDLDATWAALWDRFMPGVDYSGYQAEKETGWHRKGHLFESPFYYIEYGLAQLGALQVWRNALRHGTTQAVADYRAALALGYTRSLPELFQAAGATFAFDRQTVGELMALIQDQLHE